MTATGVLTPTPDFTRDEFDHDNYEIIGGLKVELPPMSADSQGLAFELARHLTNHGVEHNLGRACTEVLFKLPLPVDRNRKPDAAFVPYSRWARGRPLPSTNAWDVLPDLCVEVISPHDSTDDIETRIEEYFQAGVRLVWVVYPRHERFYVYDTPAQVRRLTRADTLDGGVVLPDFRLPLAELFLQPPPQPPTPT
ncbi:MAG: Uma2 family endonuclease [Isosphaera sp.]|nr:Uma2 family endonuclease [Isosphaera sp.]